MKENIIQIKTYAFALQIIKFYKYLIEKEKEYVLSKQVLRSGTSIGANTEEAIGAHSKKDFLSKLTIAYKEARETHYWLRLMRDSQMIQYEQVRSLLISCDEIIRIITAIQKTTKTNLYQCSPHR